MPPRILILLLIAAASVVRPAAAGEAEPAPACRQALDLGLLEERRARFPEALVALDQALQDPACRVAAEVGLARTLNSMNDHKKAAAAARRALSETEDPRLRSAASFEIGRALYRPGRRLTQQKAAAAAAFADAVELSGGAHEGAVRGLMRIYRETRQEEPLAALEERYPDIRVKTFAEQRRAVAPKTPAASAASAAGAASPPRVCATGETAVFDPALPHFWDPGNAAGEGYRAPEKLSGAPPAGEAAEAEGVVRLALRIDAEGAVVAVGILAGLGPQIDAAVTAAVCGWVYRPAADADGEPAECYVMDQIELPPE